MSKPITDEQVVSSENPDTGTTISTGGEMMYVQADWKDLYREELAEEKLKARKQALKEVLGLKWLEDDFTEMVDGDEVKYTGKEMELITVHMRNKLKQQLRASIKEMIK